MFLVIVMSDFASVHLQDFPKVSFPVNIGIVEKMDKVREICNAVFSLRKDANIRVRMPLKKVLLFGDFGLNEEYISIIKQEVNAKELSSYEGDISNVADKEVVLNLKECGKIFGSKLKHILEAQKTGNWKIENGKLLIADIEIEPNLFEVVYRKKDGQKTFYIREFNLLVAIEASNEKEFITEGLARDVIRIIQQTRKDNGLEISDRIIVKLYTDNEIFKDVMAVFAEYIKEQTLANDVELVNNFAGIEENSKYEIDGYSFAVNVLKM